MLDELQRQTDASKSDIVLEGIRVMRLLLDARKNYRLINMDDLETKVRAERNGMYIAAALEVFMRTMAECLELIGGKQFQELVPDEILENWKRQPADKAGKEKETYALLISYTFKIITDEMTAKLMGLVNDSGLNVKQSRDTSAPVDDRTLEAAYKHMKYLERTMNALDKQYQKNRRDREAAAYNPKYVRRPQ